MNHSRPLLLRLDSKILQPRFKEARDLLMARDRRVHVIWEDVLECYPTRRVNKEGIVVTEGMSRIQYFLESIGIIIRDSAIWLRPAPWSEDQERLSGENAPHVFEEAEVCLHEGRFRNVVPAVICSDMNYDDIRRRIITLEVPRGREIMVRREEIPVVFGPKEFERHPVLVPERYYIGERNSRLRLDGVLGLECFASKERPSLVDALWEKLAR